MRADVSTQPAFVAELQRALDAAPPYALVPAITLGLQEALGAKEVTLYLSDYGGITLEPVPPGSQRSPADRLEVDWTAAGTCFRTQTPSVEAIEAAWQVDVPVTVRAERLGVLRTVLPEEPSEADVRVLSEVGATLAYTIAAARRYTDFFERIRRRRDLALAAEIQWELLPVLAYEAPEFSLAGTLEPAYEIAGDSFDYAVDADGLTVSILDAVGHGLGAALTAALATAALRNARRRGLDIAAQARAANTTLASRLGDEDFVTAMVVNVASPSGRGQLVNAGHSLLWRCRGVDIERIDIPAELPLGVDASAEPTVWPLDLRKGDRLVLASDGALTAAPEEGDPFGEERFAELLREVRDETPTEAVRVVAQAVVSHRILELVDDVTIVCLDWRGPS